jgi:hypothetical protein
MSSKALTACSALAGHPIEYTEMDTSVLLRSNFKERVEGWAIRRQGPDLRQQRGARGLRVRQASTAAMNCSANSRTFRSSDARGKARFNRRVVGTDPTAGRE